MPAKAKPPAKTTVKRCFAPMDYIQDLYQATTPSLRFEAKTPEEAAAWRRKLRAKFVQLLGGLDGPRCDLAPQVSKRQKMDGYVRERVVFQSRENLSVPAWVLIPQEADGPLPAMICLHGHGAGKDEIVGIADDGTQRTEPGGYQFDFAVQAVQRGFLVIAPDMFGFGERRDKPEVEQSKGTSSCRRPSLAAMLMGRTVPGIRVYDVIRCVDYLQTRPEVNPKRIGLMGISGGGEVTTFAAAVEERIGAALISGYLAFWKDSIIPIRHCEDNYVPGILQYAEMPDIASLIAPRPVFFENGSQDTIFPLRSARAAFRQIQHAYDVLGVAHRCGMEVFEGPHQFWGKKGFPFLERWLKG